MIMRRVFIIHGWAHTPKRDFFPWMKKELSKRGMRVYVPLMPGTNSPKIGPWVNKLSKTVNGLRPDDIFVAHSVGAQTVLRYLSKQKNKAAGLVLVAPWVHVTMGKGWTKEEKATAKPWLKSPIDWESVAKRSGKVTAILSDTDPFVPVSDAKIFKKKLNAKTIILHGKGHIWDEDGVKKLPVALKEVMSIAKKR